MGFEERAPKRSPVTVIVYVVGIVAGVTALATCGLFLAAFLGLNALGNSLESKFQEVGNQIEPAK